MGKAFGEHMGDDIIPGMADLQGGAAETVVRQAADVTNATLTPVNTDLVFSFEANSIYVMELALICTSVAATTGYGFAFDTSVATSKPPMLTFLHQLAAGTAALGHSIADDGFTAVTTGVPSAGALTPIFGNGILVTGATPGTCRLRFRPEVAASATFKADSIMRVKKVWPVA